MSDAPRLFDFDYDDRMPRFDAERWGYGPTRGTVVVGVVCVLLGLASAGMVAGRGFLIVRTPDIARDRGRDDSGLPPMRAPDRREVQRAYNQVRLLFTAEGVAALVREGQACFAGLERAPDYRRLDYCLAFDAFATGVFRVAGSQGTDAASYFNYGAVRHTRATDAVGASLGEARSRIAAVVRMAAEVSRANVKTAPLVVTPPPPEVEEPLDEPAAAPAAPTSSPEGYTVVGPQGDTPAPQADQPAEPAPDEELPPG